MHTPSPSAILWIFPVKPPSSVSTMASRLVLSIICPRPRYRAAGPRPRSRRCNHPASQLYCSRRWYCGIGGSLILRSSINDRFAGNYVCSLKLGRLHGHVRVASYLSRPQQTQGHPCSAIRHVAWLATGSKIRRRGAAGRDDLDVLLQYWRCNGANPTLKVSPGRRISGCIIA